MVWTLTTKQIWVQADSNAFCVNATKIRYMNLKPEFEASQASHIGLGLLAWKVGLGKLPPHHGCEG